MEKIDLTKLSNDELIHLYQDGEISILDFITNNEEVSEDFLNSCKFYNYIPTDEVAEQWYEHHCRTFENNIVRDEDVDLSEIIP